MKNMILLLFLSMIAFGSCKQEQSTPVDISKLQKSMNADQEVAKLRSLLYSHTRFLAAIPPVELDAIYARLHSCGLSGSTTSAVELETCLTDIPSKEKYIEFQKGYVTYDKQLEIVKQRFPEYSQLDPEKQAELLVLVNQQEAEKVLSEYLSNRKK